MEQILNLLSENKVAAGVISILLVLVGPSFAPKFKEIVAKLKSFVPSFGSAKVSSVVAVSKDTELADQEAIRHLRDRAAEFGDESLIKDIKSIDSKFYDIHAKRGVVTNG
jgi:hypothetical protein